MDLKYDAERVAENLANQYSNQLSQANYQLALVTEENRLLKEELQFYKEKEEQVTAEK